ncbi:MAG TPA: TRAP transporter small permease subunit [Caldimonas sp.]|jgi:TRAP-type C4-dicarboxylate transport system permease small subunit|nr:TRAP transporter small permease subunit [Caldimonas sp.]HEX2541727.1 TRAP transporter small permease subunit [Caldimonas sp.]
MLPPGPDAPAPIRWLGRAVDWAIVVMGMAMVTLVFANVLLHNLLQRDLALTTEVGELLMVWVTLLGGAAAARRGAHMTITELIGRLRGGARQLADALIQAGVLLVLGLLTWYGIGIAEAGMMSVLTVLQWPMATQYAALPVASAITMVFVAWDLWGIVRGRSAAERYGERAGA